MVGNLDCLCEKKHFERSERSVKRILITNSLLKHLKWNKGIICHEFSQNRENANVSLPKHYEVMVENVL